MAELYDRYRLLTTCPAPPGLLLIWAMDDGTLEMWPALMLGVAEQRQVDAAGKTVHDMGTTVVHLDHGDGFWSIAEEARNFGGSCFPGDDPYDHLGCLTCDRLFKRVQAEKVRRAAGKEAGDVAPG